MAVQHDNPNSRKLQKRKSLLAIGSRASNSSSLESHLSLLIVVFVLEARSSQFGAIMAANAKKVVRREWTKSDIKVLKSMAGEKPVAKIAKALKRTPGATAVKAHMLGVSLDTRP
jgi:hypothetical protein